MKLTRHNGRTGKHGTYNPKHNDRRFDVKNSEHIDAERTRCNIYWDCYTGFSNVYSFEKIERMYYFEHYVDYIEAQNARNEKNRHTERNRTVDDLLANSKTCPEESIYQIGTIEESISGELLAQIASEFFAEIEEKFGSHVHILDWALHLDEGTPHIHERHVFDCENKYGELCPQQEKALEVLGIALPNPDKKKDRNNNRKQTFDAECRKMLFRICEKYNLQLQTEPTYGGRSYMEKQDFIIAKQKDVLAEVTMKLADVETVADEVAQSAYEKACALVTDTVRTETKLADIAIIEKQKEWLSAPERKDDPRLRNYAMKCLDKVIEKIKVAAMEITARITRKLLEPERKTEIVEQVKATARKSLRERLGDKQEEVRDHTAGQLGTRGRTDLLE